MITLINNLTCLLPSPRVLRKVQAKERDRGRGFKPFAYVTSYPYVPKKWATVIHRQPPDPSLNLSKTFGRVSDKNRRNTLIINLIKNLTIKTSQMYVFKN